MEISHGFSRRNTERKHSHPAGHKEPLWEDFDMIYRINKIVFLFFFHPVILSKKESSFIAIRH